MGKARSLIATISAGGMIAAGSVFFAPTTATAATGTTTRVSGSNSFGSAISADARYTAFNTASALVADDTDNNFDTYVHDRVSGAMSRVSLNDSGGGLSGGIWPLNPPAISGDGRYVAFETDSPITAEDTNNVVDVVVRDRKLGRSEVVSVASDGTLSNDRSSVPSISTDGSIVAFTSAASNLVPADTNATPDVFVHDRTTGVTIRVSVSSANQLGGSVQALGFGTGSAPQALSADGKIVTFHSPAPNLVSNDTNNTTDVFVHDRANVTTTRVSVATGGGEPAGRSDEGKISADGTVVAFKSFATNLVNNDNNNQQDVFVHDRTNATTTRASVASDGTQANGPLSEDRGHTFEHLSISGNGKRIAFASTASNLVPGDTNAQDDVFVHQRVTGQTERVSIAHDGAQGNNDSYEPSLDASGLRVSFTSTATNLVPGDTNNQEDVFVRDALGVPGPEQPVLSVGDVALYEGDSGTRGGVFTVNLSEPAATTVTVAYVTSNGEAHSGADFTARSGTLSFAPGSTSLLVKVPVVGDTSDEGLRETFTLRLSAPTGAAISDDVGVATVHDDDPATITGRRLTIGDATLEEGDEGARAAVFNVSLSSAASSTVTVNYSTVNGSATIPGDYVGRTGTLSFPAGTTSRSVKVSITPDTLAESRESFNVVLSGLSGSKTAILDGTGAGTIVDND